jgi:hypothetical protein
VPKSRSAIVYLAECEDFNDAEDNNGLELNVGKREG